MNNVLAELQIKQTDCIQFLEPNQDKEQNVIPFLSAYLTNASALHDPHKIRIELLTAINLRKVTIIKPEAKLKKLFTDMQCNLIQDYIKREFQGIIYMQLPSDTTTTEFTSSEVIKKVIMRSTLPNVKNKQIM